MTAPWYTHPAALAIIDAIACKPDVEWHEAHFPLTTDHWATFTGSHAEELRRIHRAQFAALSDLDWNDPPAFRAIMRHSADDVLGALFGDRNGNENYRTYRDDSREWLDIREAVVEALTKEMA